MARELFGFDGFIAVGLLLLWAVLALRVGRLVYAPSAARLRRRALTVLVLTAGGILLAGAKIGVSFAYGPGWGAWQQRSLLQLLLLGVPAAFAAGQSLPRLYRLARRAPGQAQAHDAPNPAGRFLAADPGLVVPVQATAAGTAAVMYWTWFAAVPFGPVSAIAPLLLAGLAAGALGLRQSRRQAAVRQPGWARPGCLRQLAPAALVLLAVAGLIGALIGAGLERSRLPDTIAMPAGHNHADDHGDVGGVRVAELLGPQNERPDAVFTLTAAKKQIALGSGQRVEAWTFNGQVPGPELHIRQGQLVEVTLVNRDIEDGVTLHWHGYDVPNGEDGVAGVTQDVVLPGQTHTYRFRAEQAGTYWYHSHQQSSQQTAKGLFGALLVEPNLPNAPNAPAHSPAGELDLPLLAHEWSTNDGLATAYGDEDRLQTISAAPGTPVRVRLINTGNDPRTFFVSGTPFRIAAIDGHAVNEPTQLKNAPLVLAAGGRFELTFAAGEKPIYVGEGNPALGLLINGTSGTPSDIPPLIKGQSFDPAAYGTPIAVPFGPESRFDRQFRLIIDQKLGIYDGAFKYMFTFNGRSYPDIPMLSVRKGDLVKTTFINLSSRDHPMHLHGHQMLVLSRNGQPVTGSPWWTDTLNVGPGETYEVAFRSDNPGIWMDHCHNLDHAAAGMMLHLAYEGVSSSFESGRGTPNRPE